MAWLDRRPLGQAAVQGIVTVDPSAGAGLVAPVGSVARLQNFGWSWVKTGAGDTDWDRADVPDTSDYCVGGRFRATYDFATHGGTVGSNPFGPLLPDNAIIQHASYEVQTTFTSPTGPDNATVGLGVTSDDAQGLVALAVINVGTPWDATGAFVDTLADGTAAGQTTKTTADRQFNLEVGVENITAGRLIVSGNYHVGE